MVQNSLHYGKLGNKYWEIFVTLIIHSITTSILSNPTNHVNARPKLPTTQ